MEVEGRLVPKWRVHERAVGSGKVDWYPLCACIKMTGHPLFSNRYRLTRTLSVTLDDKNQMNDVTHKSY